MNGIKETQSSERSPIVTTLHRVMTAVDFSKPARAAFDHAVALSRVHDAELTAVHAVPTDRGFGWEARERTALVASLRAAAQAAGVRFKVSVQHGDPAGVILLHASARRPDLIVLGTSARSAFDRFRFGSVAETVAFAATQPVLVVPAASDQVTDATAPFKNILVAVDFGKGSSEAVERALAMAKGTSRVTVVHVLPSVPPESVSRYAYHLMEPEYQRQLARDAWRRIPAIIPANASTSGRVHARVVTGHTAAAISRVANETNADLILMAVTDRSAIGRLVFGSTTARVMRTAGRPVLAVPPRANGAGGPVRDGARLAAAA